MEILNKAQLDSIRGLSEIGEEDLLNQLIFIFTTQSLDILSKLEVAVKITDFSELEGLSHKLNGSGSNLGATSLCMACYDMESFAAKKEKADYSAMLFKIKEEFLKAKNELEQRWIR